MAFSVWIVFGIFGHLILLLILVGLGFGAKQQQANLAAKPWIGLLFFPFVMGIGFLAKFIDCRNWEFCPREIVVHSMTRDARVKLENIQSITVEYSDGWEIWSIQKCDDSQNEVGVFRQTKHNQSMKLRLLEQDKFGEIARLIRRVV